MSFPDTALPIRVQALLLGDWVDFGPMTTVADDFYTDLYGDVYEGTTGVDIRRLPSQEIAITRGRSDETADNDPGSTSFILWNEDGYLTPGDPRSPWFQTDGTGWGLNTQVRILVGESVRFHGEVSEIVPEWPQGDLADDLTDAELLDLGSVNVSRLGYAIVRVTVSGILRRLSQRTKPLRSALHRRITSPTNIGHVSDYWPMEDGKDSGFFSSGLPSHLGSQPRAQQRFDWSLASDDSLWGSQALPSVGSGQDGRLLANCSSRTSLLVGGWVVEWVMTIPAEPDDAETAITVEVLSTGTVVRWLLTIGFDGDNPTVRVQGFTVTGSAVVDDTSSVHQDYLFGEGWRNLRLSVTTSGSNVSASWSWAPITPGTDLEGGDGALVSSASPGVPTRVKINVEKAPSGGVGFGHLVVHDRPGGWLIPADIGWQGEPASTRALRIANEEGIPLANVYGPPGSGLESAATSRTIGTQESLPTLDLIREAEHTENGVLCEARTELALILFNRGALYNRPVSFTLDARDKSQVANPFAPVTDDQTRANDVTASKIDGTEYRVVDENAAEIYDQSLSFSIFNDHHVKHYAGWWFHMGTHEGGRYPEVTFDLAICGDTLTDGGVTLLDKWQQTYLQARFQIVNLPPQHPAYPVVDLIIQGYTETLAPFGWTVQLNCTPADLWEVAVWGETRYTTEAVLNGGVSDSATSFSVASVTPWDDTETPFDIKVGPAVSPEVMTVTDVAGGGTTQTFTVTRGVAGYQRAHASGQPIVHTEGAVLAL